MIGRYYRADIGLHIYELGDLDDFFWPHARFSGWPVGSSSPEALVLLYTGGAVPSFLAPSRREPAAMADLIAAIEGELPDLLHAHLAPELLAYWPGGWAMSTPVAHQKMLLERGTGGADRGGGGEGEGEIATLGPEHRTALEAFYARNYPENWFEPRMLETGYYLGLMEQGSIIAAAGVHVVSPSQRVAALGNIATDQGRRGQGLALRVVGALCDRLSGVVDHIGLNVAMGNDAAIACYERLGFQVCGDYVEVAMHRRKSS